MINTVDNYKELVEEWRLNQKNKASIPSIQELLGWLWKNKKHKDYKLIVDDLVIEGINVWLFPNEEIILDFDRDRIEKLINIDYNF